MRFLAAATGLAVSIPTLLFFLVGMHTFIRSAEKELATGMTILSGLLLILSAILLFVPSIQRWQATILLITLAALGVLLATVRR